MTDVIDVHEFDELTGVLVRLAVGPADGAISTIVESGQSNRLTCAHLLHETQLEQAVAVAERVYPMMRDSKPQLNGFGAQAAEAMKVQVGKVLAEVSAAKIPELTELMHQLSDRILTPDTELGLNDLLLDLGDRQEQLRRHVLRCDDLYQANEATIGQLIGVTAVLEQAHVVALAQEIPIPRVTKITGSRATEHRQRLMVGWSASVQLRTLRTVHYGLSRRLAVLVNETVPAADSAVIDRAARAIEEAARLGQQMRNEIIATLTLADESAGQSGRHLSRSVIQLVTRCRDQQPFPATNAASPPAPPPDPPKPAAKSRAVTPAEPSPDQVEAPGETPVADAAADSEQEAADSEQEEPDQSAPDLDAVQVAAAG